MAEHIKMVQDNEYLTTFYVLESQGESTDAQHHVIIEKIMDLSPYQMLLTSLAECSGVLLHSYAQARDIQLKKITMNLAYYHGDDNDSPGNEDLIRVGVGIQGNIPESETEKIRHVVEQCRVHNILEKGLQIEMQWLNNNH